MLGVDRGHLRQTLLLAGLLAVFAAGGFIGLEAWNDRLQATGTHFLSLETPLDRLIPLRPIWVWPYLSYYALCFTPVSLLQSRETTVRIVRAFAIQFGLAFVCFLLLPIRMEQPNVPGDSLSAAALRWVYSIDPGFNIFPSLHVANACMIALAFHRFRGRTWAAPISVWAALVALSTVFVKQHYAIDLVAGFALGIVADRFALRGAAPWRPPTVPETIDAVP